MSLLAALRKLFSAQPAPPPPVEPAPPPKPKKRRTKASTDGGLSPEEVDEWLKIFGKKK